MSPAALTGKRPDIEAELKDKYHVEYTFLRKVETSEFDIDKSLNNQARFEPIDEDTVLTYQEAAERGDQFPAVIAYRPGRSANAKLVSIDGNHRLVSHDRAGKPLDVYEIDRSTKPQTIALMTFAFNTKHGRPTSERERISQALYLIDNGASAENAAAAVNLPVKIVRKEISKANADKRANEAGVDPREWEALSQVSRNRMLNISTDEGLIGAVHLAFAAKLDSNEVFELVALLNTSKSARKQRELLNAETERLRDRMQETGGGTMGGGQASRRAQTPRARVGMVLGQILALPEDVEGLARAYAESEREEASLKIMDAAEKMRKLALTLNPSLK